MTLFISITLGVAIFAAIIYLAVSRRSSSRVKMAALCALALMIVTVIVCLFIIFGTTQKDTAILVLIDEPVPEIPPPAMNDNILTELMLVAAFLVALFIVVFFLSWRGGKVGSRE